MNLFRMKSLQSQLLLLGTLSVAIALLTACIGFIWTDLRELRLAKRRQLQAQSEIVGFNSGAAILIGDRQAGEQLLAPLAAQANIAAAAIYSEDGLQLAAYTSPGAQPAPQQAPPRLGHTSTAAGELEYGQQIVEQGQRIGQFYLRADMRDLWQQTKEQLLASLIFVGASLSVALPMAWFLARAISRPILNLVHTAEFVTHHGDFTVRVENHSSDEIGSLCRAFNNMLERVDASDRALKASQDELELRVEVRTAELQQQICERERIQHDLLLSKDAAESANRAKSEFLANMSHEIRTPMNGVLGLTELVLDTEMTSEQRDSMEMVKSSAEALMIVINDILDFSKIEAGKMELDPIEFSLRDLLEDTLKAVALRAHAKGLELACDIDASLPHVVVGDPGRLRQVLLNLVGNAIKFTDQGEIAVHAQLLESSPKGSLVRLSVTDTGIGIPADKQHLIFAAFSQADGSTTRRYGGTGLGLTISNQLVALMGGELQVQSTVGQGSTFQFQTRLGIASGVSLPGLPQSPERLVGLAVLIVDDNVTNRRILVGTLRSWGALPTGVESGPNALIELRRAAAAGTPYQLVVVDAMMPEMDGFMLVEQLRQDPQLASPIVMMLTSADGLGDARRCRDLGLSGYLIKPVKAVELQQTMLAALQDALLKHSSAPPVPRVSAKACEVPGQIVAPASVRILIAEDNPVNQRVAVRILSKHGYTATVVGNGREALEALAQGAFDLVLMDVQMPELDGFEATRAIRIEELNGGRHLPIIAMTAHAMKGDRERCLAAGMDDYLTKPISSPELLRAIQSAVASQQANAIAPSIVGPTAGIKPVSASAFNRAEALERFEGEEEFLAEVIGLFLSDAPGRMNEIRAAVAASDGPRLQRAAHAIKGAVGYLAAWPAVAAALHLEEIGVSQDFSGVRVALERFEHEIKRLMASLSDDVAVGYRLAVLP